jgi:general stress protein YciG
MNKAQAGQKGGQTTVEKYGKEHMEELARKGAAAFHKKYHLVKLGTSDFAIVNRETGEPTGKTISGRVLR